MGTASSSWNVHSNWFARSRGLELEIMLRRVCEPKFTATDRFFTPKLLPGKRSAANMLIMVPMYIPKHLSGTGHGET